MSSSDLPKSFTTNICSNKGDVVKLFFLLHFKKNKRVFYQTNQFLFQDKSFINVEFRLASIMKCMINPFLVVLGLIDLPKLGGGQPPAPWCLWPCLPVAHDGKSNYCDICEDKS